MSKKKTKAGIRKCSGRRLARQTHHQRHQHFVLGPRHQGPQIVGAMGDIGVGEPQEVGGARLFGPDPRRRLDVGQLELLAATCFSQTAADLDRGSPPRSSLP